MKEVTIKVYEYDELSKEAKEKVLSDLASINVDYAWWEEIYADADEVELDITEFDIDRGTMVMNVKTSCESVAREIVKNRGTTCNTYKDAMKYLKALKELRKVPRRRKDDEEIDTTELDDNLIHDLISDYLTMLRKEFDYQTSEKAVLETISINNFYFYESGKLYGSIED